MSTCSVATSPDPTLDRFLELLESGLSNHADVRWFMSPDGLLRVCRDLAPDDVRRLANDPRTPGLLADLDDQTVATTAGSASERAELIMRVAMDCDAAASDPALRQMLVSDGVGDDPDLNRMVTATLGDLATYLDGGILPTLREVRVPLAVSCHAAGNVVHLNLCDVGRSGIAAHLVMAPFQRCDATFLTSMLRAAHATNTVRARLWVTSERTGDPLDVIEGPSAGLAMSVGMHRLHRDDAAPLDPRWVFAGAVAPDRSVGSLVGCSTTHEYLAKLSAVGSRTLVYPTDDRELVEHLAATVTADLNHFSVGSLDTAERLIDRHFRVANVFHRAVEAPPTRRLSAQTRKAAATVAAAAFVVGGFKWMRDTAAPTWSGDDPLVVVLEDGTPASSPPVPSPGSSPTPSANSEADASGSDSGVPPTPAPGGQPPTSQAKGPTCRVMQRS